MVVRGCKPPPKEEEMTRRQLLAEAIEEARELWDFETEERLWVELNELTEEDDETQGRI